MEQFKYGKLPARVDAVKLKMDRYLDLSKLPTPPDTFGHFSMVRQPWGMLGNDRYGCCLWAGAAHEHMLWGATGGHKYTFTTQNVLNAYSSATGFNPHNEYTDRGTDMQQGAKFRQNHGITDNEGRVHKIAAYLALDPGNIKQQLAACYIFGAVGIGFEMPAVTQEQFEDHKPWDVVAGSKVEGGHYVPMMGRASGMSLVSTWGALQPVTDQFFRKYNDESLVYLSDEILMLGETIEGFNREHLLADLQALKG